MRDKVRQAICQSGLFAPGDHVVCAVSGGADSMALLWALWTLRKELKITVSAAHFNHRLRHEASEHDEIAVRQFCMMHRIALRVGSGDVHAAAGQTGESIELAARRLRYAFLECQNADKIATAHHLDDNCETVLLNLIRGTGLRGLCGIPPIRGRIVRPLLSLKKQELVDFCGREKLPFVCDETNDEDDARRNRLRHQVIPLLEKENPQFARSVGQMSELLRRDEEDLRLQAEQALEDCRDKDGLCVSKLRQLPEHVLWRAMRLALRQQQVKNAASAHVSALIDLIDSDTPSASINLPDDLIVRREYDSLLFCKPDRFRFLFGRTLPMGMTELPEVQMRVFVSPAEQQINTPTVFTVAPKGELVLRCRKTGDKITLPGGTKTLKKLMIDRKIPKQKRDLIPILCDDSGVLGVWSVGADSVKSQTPGTVTVRLVPMEEPDAP